MAIDEQEEFEQGEKVRNWLRNNGGSMIGGIAIGLAMIAGWQWWQNKQEMHAEEAANSYTELTRAITAGGDERRIAVKLQEVRATYANTPYAALASMRMAAHQMDGGDAKGALATLEATGTVSDAALADLIKLREGRLLLVLGRPADALSRIAALNDPAYTCVAEEIRGDAEHTLGKVDAARGHYANALLKLPAEAPNRELLEMKLTDVGGVVPKPEAKKA
jgi:predicted negative regulator of RcsB-dependent stress response